MKTLYLCSTCGKEMKLYDRIMRLCLNENRSKKWVRIDRYRCKSCKSIKRKLPHYILPFKHYRADIIMAVIERKIDSSSLGYEDYPCEITMKRWISSSQNKHAL